MKKCAKIFLSLLLIGGMLAVSGAFVSCKSTKTMYETKKYSQKKPVKSNIQVKGTNKQNGSTYRSY